METYNRTLANVDTKQIEEKKNEVDTLLAKIRMQAKAFGKALPSVSFLSSNVDWPGVESVVEKQLKQFQCLKYECMLCQALGRERTPKTVARVQKFTAELGEAVQGDWKNLLLPGLVSWCVHVLEVPRAASSS